MSCDIAERLHESRTPNAPSAKDRIINYEELQEKNRREVEEERQAENTPERQKEKQQEKLHREAAYKECKNIRTRMVYDCFQRCMGSDNNNNCVGICKSNFKECKY